jgi:small ligand-binding sensory domain FIST
VKTGVKTGVSALTSPFLIGHATHPDWRMALALAAAQIDAAQAQRTQGSQGLLGTQQTPERQRLQDLHRPGGEAGSATTTTLGLAYFTDHYAPHGQGLLDELRLRWPGVAWAGCPAVGIAATGVEYFDEPALALMLCELPVGSFEVFSGARPLVGPGIRPGPTGAPADTPGAHGAGAHTAPTHTALVHADPATPDLAELVAELSERVATGYLFGGAVSARTGGAQLAEGWWQGGLSGVAFGPQVGLVSRVTQGCQPVGPERVVTAAQGHVVTELDGQPALPLLLRDLGIDLQDPRKALPVLRATLVGLTDADSALLGRGGQFGPDVRVRHLIGLDPGRQAVAVAAETAPGMRLAFCQRHTEAARRDLVRICSEIREELETEAAEAAAAAAPAAPLKGVDAAMGRAPGAATAPAMRGAVYISCNGRGGPHFGGPSAELKIVQHALGDVPLVGFFAAGEIARRHLYGYTGVLTVFR